ncbi:hypothetical protein A8C56_08835 [Niabella ginsenosidivorans]|uniref:Uncharacterized protein n=1 Tax=Niabella ginsenosidivorans TaxID=1176587 RepID=A0A1A9I2X4_9BACT|nr:hypothetical protein A8C56_08835 [Niabella ginsenosidivorans]
MPACCCPAHYNNKFLSIVILAQRSGAEGSVMMVLTCATTEAMVLFAALRQAANNRLHDTLKTNPTLVMLNSRPDGYFSIYV